MQRSLFAEALNGKPEPKKEEEPAYTVPVKRESNVKKNQEKKKAQEEEKK